MGYVLCCSWHMHASPPAFYAFWSRLSGTLCICIIRSVGRCAATSGSEQGTVRVCEWVSECVGLHSEQWHGNENDPNSFIRSSVYIWILNLQLKCHLCLHLKRLKRHQLLPECTRLWKRIRQYYCLYLNWLASKLHRSEYNGQNNDSKCNARMHLHVSPKAKWDFISTVPTASPIDCITANCNNRRAHIHIRHSDKQ